MGVRRAEILPEGEDVDVDGAQLAHRGEEFLVGLSHPEDDAGLGGDVGGEALGDAEDLEDARITAAGPRLLVEARDGLGVVVVDVRARLEDRSDRIDIALEVGNEDFDRRGRVAGLDLADGLGKGPGAEVREIVAIDRGEDHVAELHAGAGLGDACGFSRVKLGGPPVGDGAVGTVPCADVTQDHEGGGAVFPALADVWAAGLLADGVEVELPHQLLEMQVIRPARGAHLEPARLALGQGVGAVAPHDLVEGVSHNGDRRYRRGGRAKRSNNLLF